MITHQSDLILHLDLPHNVEDLAEVPLDSVARQATAADLSPSTTSSTSSAIVARPLVFFAILDHFLRRNENQDRVIGTLLGAPSDDNKSIEITNCFPVPHYETEDQVEVDMEHHHTMLELHQRVNPKEVIVGWYATGSGLNSYSALIQDYYNREVGVGNAVHLVLDTNLTGDTLGVRTFVSSPVGTLMKPENCMFVPVPFTVKCNETDANGLAVVNAAKSQPDHTVSLLSDMDNLEQALLQLKAMLQRVTEYVDQVLANDVSPNNLVGRYLMDLLAATPKIEATSFEKMFNSHLQDLLMVVYLSDLTRTQLSISDRLQKLI
ncbi:hypothetical protein H4R33_004705 [Dimargaris cristalligena]|uniref:Eukaryotic translation initiation factor 3 subunit F n=1 Tax=Dimargaris cristalligena TaxID=215637 RepID=A0A4P9ZRR5_9FUNG|nr:hypothetical protein H4R33_004705 [Dimargaris cristalligena]RKP36153.1 JAB1/Mov34/MPN/PAD-1 ubiquitin protease-domain-containing protein [Dimargaris cristalligena]|eukprot:RKP36153.1 JAB1/Mov34/MPN/PAD-1 ubiquitin protease-domain-containing protein [Dimargaris cristalligena]